MASVLFRATIDLHTALGTPLAGDTLFGHFCWALREADGQATLIRELSGYTRGEPWLVVSDGFPRGYVPKPTLPQYFERKVSAVERKAAKKKRWLLLDSLDETYSTFSNRAVDDLTAYGHTPRPIMQSHNTLNRLTSSTGTGAFAPYLMPQTFYGANQPLDIYLVFDPSRIGTERIAQLLKAIGSTGFGRDASIGLGKFSLRDLQAAVVKSNPNANTFLTLAPCLPQGQLFNGSKSFWKTQTRFGRHGNAHALIGNPFKTPVLMAATGAILTPGGQFSERLFVGQGLGGNGLLSKTEPATVHQGYAPVIPLCVQGVSE